METDDEDRENIPLRNKDGDIIDYAQIDPDEYEKISKFRWCVMNNGYVTGSNGKWLIT
jgi:hypothetical protein